MQHTPRPLGPDDVDAALEIRAHAFGSPTDDQRRAALLSRLERGGSIGVDIDGRLAGMLTVHALGQFFGGRSVPMGALASVAVGTVHRGKGVAPAMVRTALEIMRDEGQVISTLHPATTGFYRRLGWEIAGDYSMHSLPIRSLTSLPPGEPDRLRLGNPSDLPLLADCYRRAAPARAGWIDRPSWFWKDAYAEPHDGFQVLVCDAVDGPGIDGFALSQQVDGTRSFGFSLDVSELVAIDATAELTLWRGISSYGAQVDTVTTDGATGGLLPFLLGEQDVHETEANAFMTRVVDAPGAIAARGFPAGVAVTVHLELRDQVAPWNAGPFVLTVADGAGVLEPGGTGEVRVDIHAFSALYTGFASAHDLAAAGALRGPPDARSSLDAVFAGPRPSMLEFF